MNRGRAGLGAPSKRTPAREAVILDAIRRGMSRTKAAALAGVGHDQVRRWADAEPTFAAKLAMAEAQCQDRLLKIIDDVADQRLPTTWQAAAWKLERRWPDEYGQKSRLDVNLDLQAEIRSLADERGLDPEQLMATAEGIIAEHVASKSNSATE